MFIAKLKLGMTFVLAASLLAFAATGPIALSEVGDGKDSGPMEVATTEKPKAKRVTDLYGDALPDGALVRLGTLRFRDTYEWQGWHNYYLADGKTVLSATTRELRWIDRTTGRRLQSWQFPKGFKIGGFSPDGRLLLLTDSKTLALWDIELRKELRTFEAKGDLGSEVFARFTDDGRFVAVNSAINMGASGLLRVFEVATGKQLWQEGSMGHDDKGLVDLGFLPDGKTLVVQDRADNKVSVRDIATGEERRSFAAKSMFRLMSPDGKTLFVHQRRNDLNAFELQVWDLTNGRFLQSLGEPDNVVADVAVSNDSKIVLTSSKNFVTVWDWPSAKARGRIDVGAGRKANNLRVSPDGKTIEFVVWGESATRSFDSQSLKEIPGLSGAHRSAINGLAVAPDGQVVTAGNDNTIRVWELSTGRQLHEHSTNHPLGTTALAFRSDENLVATGDLNGGKVLIHARNTGRLLRTIDSGGQHIRSLAFAKSDSLLMISAHEAKPGYGNGDPFFLIWDLNAGKEVQRLKNRIHSPIISPDGRLLAGVDEKKVKILRLDTGEEYRVFPDKASGSMTFSPDRKSLAIGDAKGISLWEVASGKERWRIEPPAEWARDIVFSPDGRWLARIDDSRVQLFDMLRGEQIHSFLGHDHTVYQLAFEPDGRRLVTAGADTTALVWDLDRVVARQPKPTLPDGKAIDAAWNELASPDATAAFRALTRLVDGGNRSVALMRERLRPAESPDGKRIESLLRDLGSDRFAARERATQELESLDERAEPALRRFLTQDPPLEARRRAESFLARIDSPITRPERLQRLRAVEALEYTGTADAREVLMILTKGAADNELTREAKSAIERLTKRPLLP